MTTTEEMEVAARIELFDQLLLSLMKENKLQGEEEQRALKQLGQTVHLVQAYTDRGSYPDNMLYVFDEPYVTEEVMQ